MTVRKAVTALLTLSLLAGVVATSGCSSLSGQTPAEDAQKMYKNAPKDPNE